MERGKRADRHTDRQRHVQILELEDGWRERDEQRDRQKHVPILESEGGGERETSRQTETCSNIRVRRGWREGDEQTDRNMFQY